MLTVIVGSEHPENWLIQGGKSEVLWEYKAEIVVYSNRVFSLESLPHFSLLPPASDSSPG